MKYACILGITLIDGEQITVPIKSATLCRTDAKWLAINIGKKDFTPFKTDIKSYSITWLREIK
jgi:hypothetical protein